MTVTYNVAAGVIGRVVDVEKGTEINHTTMKNHTFVEADVVFEPVRVFQQHGVHTRDYGFRTGNQLQRQKYVLVIDGTHVQILDDEDHE